MALNVISNFAANVAHRNLVMSDAEATSSLAKLSSGKRIVSASDDAASLAIGSRLRAEVSAMKQAAQNASQAASMLQVADGALSTVGDILVRMKALAVQASSGQFGSIERAVLDSEYQALVSEITRISEDTEFNGTQLINGGAAVFDADGAGGTSNDQTLEGTTNELTAGSAPGFSVAYDTTVTTSGDTFRLSYDDGTEEMAVTNVRTGDRQTITITTAFNSQLTANGQATTANSLDTDTTVDVNFSQLGVTVTLDDNFDRTNATIGTEGNQTVTASAGVTVNGSADVVYNNSGLDITGLRELVALGAYNQTTGELAINIDVDATNNTVDFGTATTGLEVSVDGGAYAATDATDLEDGGVHTVGIRLATSDQVLGTMTLNDVAANGVTTTETLTIDIGELLFGTSFTAGTTSQNFSYKVGTGAETFDSLSFNVSAASGSVLGVDNTEITSAGLADTASAAVSAAIDTVNQQRATIGAAQNRLNFAANNLAATIENAEAARSGLLDLDVAQEISTFTSKNILVQTGISMLAQANAVPQNLLRLFQ